jgi:hypothetical protein
VDGENRDGHGRAVVRALRSLDPLTVPTVAERQRIRDRILLSLDADESGEPNRSVLTDPTDSPAAAAAPSRSLSPSPDVGPRQRSQTRPDTPRGQSGPAKARPDDKRRGALAGARGRLAVAALAVLALVGSLAGMSVLLSRDALPGDALYGIKRTAEAASLGLTFGDEPRALKHLEFAAARISEIETLARRYPNPADAPVGGYLTALTDFDNDAIAGSRQLIALGTGNDGRLLESLRDWSKAQASRLQRVAAQLPEAARNRQHASRALLDGITTRTGALLARMDCYQITSGSYDDIGALPATGACEERDPAPASSASPPSVAAIPDNPGTPTGPETPSPPVPSAEPTPDAPLLPVPGATVSVPAPTRDPAPSTGTTTTPPLIQLPPLLPGLGIG